MTAAHELPGILLPYWLFFALLGLALAAIAGLAFLILYHRNRPDPAGMVAPAPPLPLVLSAWHPDRLADLENLLAGLKARHEHLQQTYAVLLGRHKTLIREYQRLQQSTSARRPQEPAEVRLKASA